jgi:hypothetical protein
MLDQRIGAQHIHSTFAAALDTSRRLMAEAGTQEPIP